MVTKKYLSDEYGKPVPMSFDEADQGNCNPGFSHDEGRRINCQVCVSVYELRRRGYNVIAKPRSFDDRRYEALVYDPALTWIDRLSGKPMRSEDFAGFPSGGAIDFIDDKTRESGRYILSVTRPRRAGHSVILERSTSGVMTVFDPQSGTLYEGEAIFKEFGNSGLVLLARIDNAVIDPDIIGDFIEVV